MWLIIFYLVNIVGIQETHVDSDVPKMQVTSLDANLQRKNGVWFYNHTTFSGYVIEMEKGVPIAKIPVQYGRENGTSYGWYVNGEKKFERNYSNGKRSGNHKGWHRNGALSYNFHFRNDLYDGEQRTYFDNGQVWQQLHYVNGYEEGKQKTWNKEGRVINNFTVKNKKLYGVIGRYDCLSVMVE